MSLTTVCLALPIYAEGGDKRPSGDNGVNRRVRTKSVGYKAVKGTIDISFKLPVDRTGTVTAPNDDIPSFYLGGTAGTTEFDGGIEYHSKQNTDAATGEMVGPGWGAFISSSTDTPRYTSPHYWDGHQSRAWRSNGSGGSEPGTGRMVTDIEFTFHSPNTAWTSVYIGAMPLGERASEKISFFYNKNRADQLASAEHPVVPYRGDTDPSDPDSLPRRYTSLDDARVKRVVALTRVPTTQHPNLWLNGITVKAEFSNGQIRKTSWEDWVWSTAAGAANDGVEQSGITNTGYDAPEGTASDAVDLVPGNIPEKGHNPQTGFRTIIQFPSLSVSNSNGGSNSNVVGRSDTPSSWSAFEAGVSRYKHETVWINLRRATPQKKGKAKQNH